jgi:serine/threonine-protein kinase
LIGQTISHYKILEKLGQGGMGVVYKAQDTKLDRIVALKFLPSHLEATEEEKARFVQEAKAASALNHPNVCTIFDIKNFEGQTFIVMEYVEGKTLREAKASLGLKQSVDVISQVAEGLAAAHDKGIVHRDIKADNIMVRKDGRAQIMDFGLAKLPGVSLLTKAGSTVGTTAYMSPEQAQGAEADHRTDIFSLGVLLYELLAKQLPFKGAHEAAVMYEVINVDPKPPSSVNPEIEPDLDRIVMKCLEKDQEDRYQSAREVAIDLKRFKRDSHGAPQRAQSVAAAQPKSKKGIWLSLAIVVAVLLAGTAFLLLRNTEEALDSLAVLPFENAGNDQSMEYMSDGVTETIINSLTKIPDLRVVPRSTVFRFKGKNIDPMEAGSQLKVRAILTGRIIRQGHDLSIQVDLVDVHKQSQLWGEQYRGNANDVLQLQDQITAEVSNRLRRGLSGDVRKNVTKRYTDNPEAYKLYLQGRFHWNKRKASDIDKALDLFTQAITLDPNYSLAYVGLADCYVLQEQYAGIPGSEVYPKAVIAAKRALEIDNSLAEAHSTLGLIYSGTWQWDDAEREYKTSLSLNTNYPTAYHWYSIMLFMTARNDEGMRMIKRAQELDPLSQIIGLNVGLAFLKVGKPQEAIREMDAVLALDSTFGIAHYRKVMPYLQLGRAEEARKAALEGVEVSGRSAESLSFLGYVLGRMGKQGEALSLASELEKRFAGRTSSGYYVARIYAGIGDMDSAFKWLRVDLKDHPGSIIWLADDIEWEPYRNDPRYIDLLKKIGLRK